MHDATTPPRAGEVSVGRRGEIHRQVLHPLRFARPPDTGTVMDILPNRGLIEKDVASSRKYTRKFSQTVCVSVMAELLKMVFYLLFIRGC